MQAPQLGLPPSACTALPIPIPLLAVGLAPALALLSLALLLLTALLPALPDPSGGSSVCPPHGHRGGRAAVGPRLRN